jgi:hypothetical protein
MKSGKVEGTWPQRELIWVRSQPRFSKKIGVIRSMEAKLGKPLLVPEDPQIVAALGAARFAQRGSTKC